MFINIAIFGFALAGGAYALLSLQLLTSWRGHRPGGILLVASSLTVLWAFLAAYAAARGEMESGLLTALDSARMLAWILFLAVLLGFRGYRHASWVNTSVWSGIAATAAAVVAGVMHAAGGLVFVIPGVGALAYLSLLSLSVVGLVLVEHLYRNSHQNRRWAIKFLCIGLGSLFAYDIFLFSQALMQHQLTAGPAAARGIIQALVVPLLAITISRNPDWSLNVFVSRRAVLHSVALFGSGVYLIIMAAGGYYLRLYGGSWGGVAQASFLFGAVLLLLVILFSGRLRSTIKVLFSKHFLPYKYDYRDEWMRLTATLSDAGGPLCERAVRALAEIVESPSGELWLRHEGGVLLPAGHWNLTDYQRAPEQVKTNLISFCEQYAWIIDLDDCRLHPENYHGLQLPPWLHRLSSAWLMIPLFQHEKLQGFVLLSHPRAVHKLSWEDFGLLKAAASQVSTLISQQQAQEALSESRQFEAYNRFSTFVVHDLKNLIAQLSLLISNASRHRHNPEFFDDAIETLEHSIDRMQRLLSQLRSGELGKNNVMTTVDLCSLLESVVARQAFQRPVPVIGECERGLGVRAQAEQLAQVVTHIVENAQEATPDSGTVGIRVLRQSSHAIVEVSDSGDGMTNDFIERDLFRPFASTKDHKGMGIGAYQARTLLRELGGDIEVSSTPGDGSCFRLLFPYVEATPGSNGQLDINTGGTQESTWDKKDNHDGSKT